MTILPAGSSSGEQRPPLARAAPPSPAISAETMSRGQRHDHATADNERLEEHCAKHRTDERDR
jgi:hypothetical protein